ncbi:MAG: hypothetical protein M1839_008304 [Geoglossum umbratile]|nr:MAG: hypothetical protein M1839_008304 [Geoglossum umbratile]
MCPGNSQRSKFAIEVIKTEGIEEGGDEMAQHLTSGKNHFIRAYPLPNFLHFHIALSRGGIKNETTADILAPETYTIILNTPGGGLHRGLALYWRIEDQRLRKGILQARLSGEKTSRSSVTLLHQHPEGARLHRPDERIRFTIVGDGFT